MYAKVEVYGKTNEPFATVVAEAFDLHEAGAAAIQYLKQQNPEIDISFYDLPIAMQVFSLTPLVFTY